MGLFKDERVLHNYAKCKWFIQLLLWSEFLFFISLAIRVLYKYGHLDGAYTAAALPALVALLVAAVLTGVYRAKFILWRRENDK